MFDIEKYKGEVSETHYNLMVECKKRMEIELSAATFKSYSDIERSAVVSGIKGGFLRQVGQIVENDNSEKKRVIDDAKEKERIKKQRERAKKTPFDRSLMYGIDSTLIPSGRFGDELKMRLGGYSYAQIAREKNLTSGTIRVHCSKAARLARSATTRNVKNGNDKQEIPINDIKESNFNESGLCASGYILRLRDIAHHLSSQ